MAHIDQSNLIEMATAVVEIALEVQQDPAVRKAWSEAGRDFKQAFKSGADALVETRGAWSRSAEESVGGLADLR